MELNLVLGTAAVVGAACLFWWGMTARPSAARTNLVIGLPDAPPPASRLTTVTRRLGERMRRLLPHPLIDGLEVNLVQAGHPGGLDLPRILGIKVLLAAVGVLGALAIGNPVLAFVVGLLLFFLPDYWVMSERDRRQSGIRADIADVIDQLAICVEAGLGFDAALARVVATTDGPLTEELRHTTADIRAGVPRAQALRALSDRAQVTEVRQLVSALIQSQKHGVSMADTLRVQSVELRTKRSQRAEEQAAKLPVKLIFPIILCFLPVFIIITVVPSLINVFTAL